MIEILHFVFSSFWVWIGTVIFDRRSRRIRRALAQPAHHSNSLTAEEKK